MQEAGDLRLGDLEVAVMDQVWRQVDRGRPSVSVADIHEGLSERDLAYTTVMTVLGNLYKKGLLTRVKDGKSFLYSPTKSRQEIGGSLLQRIGRQLFANSSTSWVTCLLGSAPQLSSEELAALKARIAEIEEAQNAGS